MNLRPSGYEPDELPDCSTPRRIGQDNRRPTRTEPRGVRIATIGDVEESALVEEVGHRLARAGLRWTAGRRAVVDIFESAQAPLSMQELQDRAAGADAAGWIGDPSAAAVREMAAELFPGAEIVGPG